MRYVYFADIWGSMYYMKYGETPQPYGYASGLSAMGGDKLLVVIKDGRCNWNHNPNFEKLTPSF